MKTTDALSALAIALALAGCAATTPVPPQAIPPLPVAGQPAVERIAVDPALARRILALDPERVTDDDVRQVLARGPTPRVIGLHGGIYPVHLVMESFARFLVAMGYPEARVRHPGDGRLSHSPYENSAQIAGLVAWYYEREALMPMLVGHSQGGIQAVKVLHELAGGYSREVRVWNPLTDRAEDRTTMVDPFSGRERPVVGLTVGYASAVGAGGAALLLPNQWSMTGRLRTVPDTVEEFVGYSLGVDLIAWDVPGARATYVASGTASVRNVRLPAEYSHVTVAATEHLARDPAMRQWLNGYAPGAVNGFPANAGSTENALWGADVWFTIKKHWVLQAQRVVRAQEAAGGERRKGA